MDFLAIPLPVESMTNCPVCISRALLQYFLWYRGLQATDVSFRSFIFAACARFISRHLNNHQFQLLISAQTNWGRKRILNSPRNEEFREFLCRPVEGLCFEGIWIVKDPSLAMPHSKVLLWFHGTTVLLTCVSFHLATPWTLRLGIELTCRWRI